MFASMASNPTDERVIWAPLWNDALIGRSRSIMCTEFLKTDADVMVIIDDDIVWEPADFWKIVEGARETHGVYGGAYVTRSTEPHISSRHFAGDELVFAQTPNRRPIKFQYLATGFMAIHRDVMESMLRTEFVDAYGTHRVEECQLGADRPFYPFFSPFFYREADGRLHYLSEDWAFSNRAHQAGHDVWVDQSIILIHMGWYPFTVRDLNHAEHGLPSTGIDRVEVGGRPESTGEPLIDSLATDIAEWTGDTVGDVRRMMEPEVSAMALNRLWLSRAENEADWYRREDVGLNYITDLAGWHQRGGAPFEHLALVAGKTVLDFGCGIGTWALAARREARAVFGVEISPVTREFAAWRAQKYGLPITLLESLDAIAGQFDVVCAWHVFEHLPDAEGVLDQLLGLMKPDGILLTDSGFNDASTAQHHIRTDWEQVLESRGLSPVMPEVYQRVAVLA
jgi:2-polyprenyl-3-methyl-5-hydroxy-6-metoxy-1,4-benzoquinol methylase